MRVIFLLVSALWVSDASTCPDTLLNNTGTGGAGAAGLANVSDLAACCDLCHNEYHDECVTWVFGETGSGSGYPKHNCAIMTANHTPRLVPGHVSGIVSDGPTPPPPESGAPCNADLQCDLQHNTGKGGWRCVHDADLSPAAQNNCHLPGPGTAGNSTCVCSMQECSKGPTKPSNASALQYLMIGDSISLGLQPELEKLVEPRGWELTHNPGNAASSNLGAHCLDNWLQTSTRRYDVISWNFGLHDLGFDTERITVQQYTALFTNITTRLVNIQQAHGSKLLWVDTTPVPTVPTYSPECNNTSECLNPPRFDADVVLYNAAAAQVVAGANAKGANISHAKLYDFVLTECGGKGYAQCDGFQLPMNVHFTPTGWSALADKMASFLFKM